MQKQDAESRMNFRSVQYLRGIAAIAVVYFHTKVYLGEFVWPVGRQFGYGGVDLFFAISGFIMMVTTTVSAETPVSFYLKRIIRVVPMYWGATLATLALFLLVPSAFIKQTVTGEHVILSMLFIPHPSPSEAGAAPFFKIGWTLNFEMFFYLVFGLTLLLAQAWHRLLTIALLFIGLTVFGALAEPTNAALGYYTNPFVLEFLMGAIIGYLIVTKRLEGIPGGWAWAGLVLAVAFLTLSGGAKGDSFGRTLLYGVPTAAMLASAVIAEQRGTLGSSRLMKALGDASYSIYLAHPFVLTAFKVGARGLQVPVTDPVVGILGIILAVLTSVAFGYGLFLFVERPLLRLLRGVATRGRRSASKLEPGPAVGA